MLPTSLLPSGALDTMRMQANMFFTTPVSVYETSIQYDRYGQEIITSGFRFSTSGYTGKISGRDRELLEALKLLGSETETNILVLIPIDNPLRITDTIVVYGTNYRVIWHNDHTQDSVQLYQKAICARKILLPEQRYTHHG